MISHESHGEEVPQVLYSCNTEIRREGEKFLSQHVFTHIFEGSLQIDTGMEKYTYHAGDSLLVKRNQLVRSIKFPAPGGLLRTVSIFFSQELLRDLSLTQKLPTIHPYTGRSVVLLKTNNSLYTAYATSLIPYENGVGQSSAALTNLKAREAIVLLQELNPAVNNLLFDFHEPGKIDLEAYMNQHFTFNVELRRFAYLTGRSVATFKRDFEKVFHTSPSRWLLQKRLEEAHYQIKEKGRKPSDVYLEVGFEDLSHFSFAFKKAYGVAPSLV